MTGGGLDGLNFEELQQIESQLKRGLLSVRQKKVAVKTAKTFDSFTK